MADEAVDQDPPTLLLDDNTTFILPDDLELLHGLDVDELEVDTMYDSDTHEEYVPEPPDEDDLSDDDATPQPSTSDVPQRRKRRRQREVEPRDADELIHTFANNILHGRNGHVWSTTPYTPGPRRSVDNTIPYTEGPTPATHHVQTPLQSMELFFDELFIQEIVTHTNSFIDLVARKYKVLRNSIQHTTTIEVKALLGILIMTAVRKDNHVSTREMWKLHFGSPIYKAAMSEERFCFLIRCLRFDNLETREERRASDKFAPIRTLWDMFVEKCKDNYQPGRNITVDEQLLAFRGRCGFRQYIANKPAKYGIKIVMACDVNTSYMLNAMPYIGAHTRPPKGMMLGEYFTMELLRPYYNTQRTVTTDNWFTSYPLATSLLEKNLKIVGTIRKKPYIPEEMLKTDGREVKSSAFLFDHKSTLLSCKVKKNKVVLLLSTEHSDKKIGEENKPEIVLFYNRTKGGVDTLDQMSTTYSCSRRTRRWPLCVFYDMINIACVNAYVIHSHKCHERNESIPPRRTFLQDVALELIRPFATERLNQRGMHHGTQFFIRSIFKICGNESGVAHNVPSKPSRCVICPRKKDVKTKLCCISCKRIVCVKHMQQICSDCLQ